jgi:hypothetical protein
MGKKTMNSNPNTERSSPIRLRDEGIASQTVKTSHKQQAKVRETGQGIEISRRK